MKLRSLSIVLVAAFILGGNVPVFAEDVVPTRADQVSAIQNQYGPKFDAQWARLLAIATKVKGDGPTYAQYKLIVADFKQVRLVIDTGLASATAELEGIAAYAEEETGEFSFTIQQLEDAVASIKSITCVKGKAVRKITAVKPVCPKGYTKKKL